MAVRYRLIVYEGPEDWIERTFAKSINGCFELPDARIMAREITRLDFDVGVAPHPFPKWDQTASHYNEQFEAADDLVSRGDRDPPIGK